MKLTFISNYINHHQIPLSDELYRVLGKDYVFVQTEPMEEERIRQGWAKDYSALPYLQIYADDSEGVQKIIDESDVVIFDGLDDESYIAGRLAERKIVIRAWERLYREGQWKAISPKGLIRKYHDHTRYSDAPVYLLCCGAYVADDFEIIRAYRGKRFKWGYFPAFIPAKDGGILKKNSVPKILWAGRFLKLKHAMDALQAVKEMADEGFAFEMTFIGGGECEEELKKYTEQNRLEERVSFTGFLKPEEVRAYMDDADIYLFTSNFEEGWGAVINEAMNSGCAVIASHAVGAAPFLIKDKVNGLIYRSGNLQSLEDALRMVLSDENLRKKLGEEAYRTIAEEWNPNTAAERLVALCDNLMRGEITFCESGPLSEAKVIPQRKMYAYVKGEWTWRKPE